MSPIVYVPQVEPAGQLATQAPGLPMPANGLRACAFTGCCSPMSKHARARMLKTEPLRIKQNESGIFFIFFFAPCLFEFFTPYLSEQALLFLAVTTSKRMDTLTLHVPPRKSPFDI